MIDLTTPESVPIREQSAAERTFAAKARFVEVRPCLYENWPSALKVMSFATHAMRVSQQELIDLIAQFDSVSSITESLQGKLSCTIGMFVRAMTLTRSGMGPAGITPIFAKLSTRAPKDVVPSRSLKCYDGRDVVSLFIQSARILEDLLMYRDIEHGCRILIREWHDIPQEEEWRCFIRKGNIVGISQYHHKDCFVTVAMDDPSASRLIERLSRFLMEDVIPALPIETVVVDVWLGEKPFVVELNPFTRSTDPCLLSFEEMESLDSNGAFPFWFQVGGSR